MFEDLQVKPLQRACYSTHVFSSAKHNANVEDSEIEHGVMSDKVWGFPAEGGQIKLTYKFLSGSDGQKNGVRSAMNEWERYANVVFEEKPDQADIRITFKRGDGSWSVVGRQALQVKDNSATMNLGWLPTFESQQTAEDIGTVLHELGHALGMLHEHQSPARGGTINLKLDAVYTHYTPLLQNDRNLVLTQVINQYNSDEVEAFSRLDLKSIMMYPMDRRLNEEHIDVAYNTDLSEIDKAFIMLTYPGRKINSVNMSLEKALQIAAVPADGAKEIQALVAGGQKILTATSADNFSELVVEANKIVGLLEATQKKIKELVDQNTNYTSEPFQHTADPIAKEAVTKKIQKLISKTFESARHLFFAYNKRSMASYRINKRVLHSIDSLVGPSYGIFDTLGGIVQQPVFKDVVNVIVNKVLAKHGIPSNTKVYNPDMTGEDVLGGVRSLLLNHAVKEKVVGVQKASGIVGDVRQVVLDVGKILTKIPAFLRKRAAQAEVDLLLQPSWMRFTVKNATGFSIVPLNSHFEQGEYLTPPTDIQSLEQITFSGYCANKKGSVLAGTAFRVYFIEGNKYFDFALGWKKTRNGSYEVGLAASHDPKEGYNNANKMGGRLETDIFKAKNINDDQNYSFRLHITVAASQNALCVVKEVIWKEGEHQPADDPMEEAPAILNVLETAFFVERSQETVVVDV